MEPPNPGNNGESINHAVIREDNDYRKYSQSPRKALNYNPLTSAIFKSKWLHPLV